MAWGNKMPSGNGNFSPEGDHGAWKENIQKYFEQEMSTSERAKFENWHVDYRRSISRRFVEKDDPIKFHQWPSEFHLAKTYSDLGSLVEFHNGLLGVDQALKEIIEQFEPNIHQFSPIKINTPRGKEYHKQYYAMVISQFHDSFSPADSDEGSWEDKSYDAYWGERIKSFNVSIPKKQNYNGLALKKNTFGVSHLWREESLKDPDIYLSDELVSEIKRQCLRMPTTYQLKEV